MKRCDPHMCVAEFTSQVECKSKHGADERAPQQVGQTAEDEQQHAHHDFREPSAIR